MKSAFRPLIREAQILFFAWARHDMQRKNPHHPDLPYVVVRLRDLKAERHAHPGYLRRISQWL